MANEKVNLVPIDTIGQIGPEAGSATVAGTFEVDDLSDLKTIVAEGLGSDDELHIVRENHAEDGFENYGVKLSTRNKSATPTERGIFSVRGSIKGNESGKPVSIYYLKLEGT